MREQPMNICPLLTIARIGGGGGFVDCMEDRCAWFHIKYDEIIGSADGACALVGIADTLELLQRFGMG